MEHPAETIQQTVNETNNVLTTMEVATFRPLDGTSVNDLICIECCCGSAKLSFSLKDLGFSVYPIDHSRNRHKPRCKVILLDLLNEYHLEIFWDLLDDPNVFYVHWAPPCGTASKARELPLAGVRNPPMPLRSAQFLFGLPNLEPTSQARVTAANQLYRLCVQGMVKCLNRGILASMENPKSAYTWDICNHYAAEMNVASEWKRMSDVHFQHCMHGGKRNKWSTWKCTSNFLTHLNATCDGKHDHAAWGIVFDEHTGQRSFATALEAEYPTVLCQKVARAVLAEASMQGAAERPTNLLDLKPSFDHGFNRIATFHQPRGNRFPQLLSEFSKVVKKSETSASDTIRLLRSQLGNSGEPDQIVGVLRTPEQFLDESVKLQHPADKFLAMPDVLKIALFKVVTLGPLELSKMRLQAILSIKRKLTEFKLQEAALHDSLPVHLKEILKNKQILLFKHLLEESQYPDAAVVDELILGVDVVGKTPTSGIFERKLKPAVTNYKELRKNSKMLRKSFKTTNKPTDTSSAKAVWEQSLDEAKKGWLLGPYYSEDEVSGIIGSDLWVPTHRFPLIQRNKTRVIDDAKESGINDALKTTEKLNLMDSEAMAVVLTYVAEVCVKQEVHIDLQCGSHLDGRLHQDWTKQESQFYWEGRALDLAHAYKQIGCSSKTMWASIVQTYDPETERDAYFISASLMFGSTASVYSFNRISRALWFLMARYLNIISINFYDDYPMIEPATTAKLARTVSETFFKILGWDIAEGQKSLPFSHTFDALGISVQLEELHKGSFRFALKPSRTEELLATANEILETGRLSRADCQSLVGKLLFARGQMSSTAIRSIIDSLLQHVSSGSSSCVSNDVHFAVCMLKCLLSNNKPKLFVWSDPLQPIVVFTDGASEGDHTTNTSHTVGAILIDPVSKVRHVLDGLVHQTLVNLWCSHVGSKFICQVEAYPVLCIMCQYARLFAHRRILFFLDNDASRHAFIKCTSQSRSMQALAYAFHQLNIQCKPWFARVPTESNPADLPSRGQTAMAAKLFKCKYQGLLRLDDGLLQFLVNHSVQTNKRKAGDSNV